MAIQALIDHELPVDGFIFKHSPRCGISASAAESVRRYAAEHDVFWVDVVEQRPLSSWIAERLGVQHESPQLIELKGGQVRGVWSHSAIRSKINLEDRR